MPSPQLLEFFPTPTDAPIIVEHIAEEFTSQCPRTGQPDFGIITIRFQPRPASAGGQCVELKSLKLYLQSFRAEGIFYEAVTDRIRADLIHAMNPTWLHIHTNWRGRGGIRSIIRAEHGEVPAAYRL